MASSVLTIVAIGSAARPEDGPSKRDAAHRDLDLGDALLRSYNSSVIQYGLEPEAIDDPARLEAEQLTRVCALPLSPYVEAGLLPEEDA